MSWNNLDKSNPGDVKLYLIDFYKERYLYYCKVGVGNETRNGTFVTRGLIQCTANRLDQIIKGVKTEGNTCTPNPSAMHRGLGTERKVHNSNRSFIGTITSKFQLCDLELTQQDVVTNYINYGDGSLFDPPMYIDKITTAYNSEIMREILSHNN